jgi:hypothetical protein
MSIEHYYFVYSAMTQSVGSLIAIIGVFMIFRIQIQRERLGNTYRALRRAFYGETWRPGNEIKGEVTKYLDENKNTDVANTKHYKLIETNFNNLGEHGDNLDYIKNEGMRTIWVGGVVFIYYILALHLNSFFYPTIYRLSVFIFGAILSVLAIFVSIRYIFKCLMI